MTFIPDVHGDARALQDSLIQAGCAERRGHRFMIHTERVVQTGDLIDRYGENLAVLDTMLAVRDRAHLTILAGNHEVMALNALFHPNHAGDVYAWVRQENGGYAVLREIAKRERLLLRRPIRDSLEIFPVDRKLIGHLPARKGVGVVMGWEQTVKKKRLHRYDLPQAFARTRELFLQEPLFTLFREMKLAENVARTILTVHAGVAETLATIGPGESNTLWEAMVRWRNFVLFHQGEALAPLIWARRQEQPRKKLLTREIAEKIRQQGYRIVLHGHEVCPGGKQTILPCYGVRDVNGDVGMSRGYASPSTWGYVQLSEQGLLTAESSEGGKQNFGRIVGGKYTRP